VIDPQSRAVLQNLILRESHSLLHYICESFPWMSPGEREIFDRLQEVNKDEMEATAVLARFLFKHRIVPAALGSYPMSFTNINYTALDHLLPLVIDDHNGRVVEVQKDLSKIQDAEARQQVEQFLQVKQSHLQALEAMAKNLNLAGQPA
jgi:hypothetical protein